MIKILLKSLGSRLYRRKMNVLSLLCGKGNFNITGYAAANKTRQDIWAPTGGNRWLVRQVVNSLILLGFLGKDGVHAGYFGQGQEFLVTAGPMSIWESGFWDTLYTAYEADGQGQATPNINTVIQNTIPYMLDLSGVIVSKNMFVTDGYSVSFSFICKIHAGSVVPQKNYNDMPQAARNTVMDGGGQINLTSSDDKIQATYSTITDIAGTMWDGIGTGHTNTWSSGDCIEGGAEYVLNLKISGAVKVPLGVTLKNVPKMNVSVDENAASGGTLGQSANVPFDLTASGITGLTTFTATTKSGTQGDYLKVGSGTAVTLTKNSATTNTVPQGDIQIQGGSTVTVTNTGKGNVTIKDSGTVKLTNAGTGAVTLTGVAGKMTVNNSDALYLGASASTDAKANLKGVNTAPTTSSTEYRYYAKPTSTASPMTVTVNKPGDGGVISSTVNNASVSFPIGTDGAMPFTIPQTESVSITETTATGGTTTALTSVTAARLSSFITGGLTATPKVAGITITATYDGVTANAVTLTPSDPEAALAIKDGAGNTLLDTVKAATGSNVTVTAAPTTFTNLDGTSAKTSFWYTASTGTLNTAYKTISTNPSAASIKITNALVRDITSTSVRYNITRPDNNGSTADTYISYDSTGRNFTITGYESVYVPGVAPSAENDFIGTAGYNTTSKKTSTVTATAAGSSWYVGQYGGTTYFYKSANDLFYGIYGNLDMSKIDTDSIVVQNDLLSFSPKSSQASAAYNTLAVATPNVPTSPSASLYDTLFGMPTKINALGPQCARWTKYADATYKQDPTGDYISTGPGTYERHLYVTGGNTYYDYYSSTDSSSTLSSVATEVTSGTGSDTGKVSKIKTTVTNNTAGSPDTTTYTLDLGANKYTVTPVLGSGTETTVSLTNGQYTHNGTIIYSTTPLTSYEGTVYYTGLSVSPETGKTEAVIDKPFTSDASLLRGDVTFKGATAAGSTYSYILTKDSSGFLAT